MRKPEIYFINYKNSVMGVGGVGTVSRELINSYPDIHFIFWDGTEASRGNDLGIKLEDVDYRRNHLLFFKKHLWPILHGAASRISEEELSRLRRNLCHQAKQVVDQLMIHADKVGRDSGDVFWVNDYTALPLIGEISNRARGVIIFSFRTPFGDNGGYPRLGKKDTALLLELLKVHLVSFHRKRDMDNFIRFINERGCELVDSIRLIDDMNATIKTVNGHCLKLSVFPMGNNPQYRKELSATRQAKQIYNQLKRRYRNQVIVVSISRFEHTKGVEYEVDLIDKLLCKYPDLRGRFVFLRYTYRSKKKVDDKEYRELHDRVVMGVARINQKYGSLLWQPIVYSNGYKLNDQEVTAVLSASDVMIIASAADGFNHLSLEAIHSQRKSCPKIQLLLSDIGATDYLEGYDSLCLDLDNDSDALYQAIVRPNKEVSRSYERLKCSGELLSSKKWLDDIIDSAKKILNNKK